MAEASTAIDPERIQKANLRAARLPAVIMAMAVARRSGDMSEIRNEKM